MLRKAGERRQKQWVESNGPLDWNAQKYPESKERKVGRLQKPPPAYDAMNGLGTRRGAPPAYEQQVDGN